MKRGVAPSPQGTTREVPMSDERFQPRILVGLLCYLAPAVVIVPIATGAVPGLRPALPWLAPLLTILCAVAGTAAIIGPLLRHTARDKALLASGRQARAQVEGAVPTGLRVNKVPQLRLSVWVLRAGHAPYRGQVVVMADPRLRLALGPGAEIAVCVDPDDPAAMAFAGLTQPAPLPELYTEPTLDALATGTGSFVGVS